MIELNGLTKRYGPVTALDALTLSIRTGEILGLLGPNGAGKTTTLRLMAGLAQPDAGSVSVDGFNPWTAPDEARRQMGVLPDPTALWDRLSVEQNLLLFAGLFGQPRAAVALAMEQTGVLDLAGRRAGKLSKGQRQRVALARAIIHQPKLLVLDEPAAGLDPTAAAALHDQIRRFRSQGVTVVLSSHDMAEVDSLCDRVAILDRGRLMACAPPAQLKNEYGRRSLTATVQTDSGLKRFEWPLDDPAVGERLTECSRLGRLLAVRSTEASLAEVFIHLTGRELQ